jgi:hypothetical protein
MAGLDPFFVIAGLDPAIHDEVQRTTTVSMDARVKPGHENIESPGMTTRVQAVRK